MPFKSKDSLLKSEFFSLMTSSTGEIDRIIFPNGAQVGLTHPDFRSNLDVYGSITSRKSGPDTIRGSLTKLLDGTPFLVGGNNASLVTGSGGEITISISPGGANTQVQFNDAGILGGDSNFVFNKTTNTLKKLKKLPASKTQIFWKSPKLLNEPISLFSLFENIESNPFIFT